MSYYGQKITRVYGFTKFGAACVKIIYADGTKMQMPLDVFAAGYGL